MFDVLLNLLHIPCSQSAASDVARNAEFILEVLRSGHLHLQLVQGDGVAHLGLKKDKNLFSEDF